MPPPKEDERELVDKVRYYLAQQAKREEMAARARARALAQYDEAKFWTSMVALMRARAAQRRQRQLPLYLDRPFRSAFGAWRFKYLVIFLFAGRLGLLLGELALLARVRRFSPAAAVWFVAMGLHVARRSSRLATGAAALARRLRGIVSGR